jgi:predicted nicotinamide N-methyase
VAEALSGSLDALDLQEYRLRVNGREWSVLHIGTLIDFVTEQLYLSEANRPPFGLTLWPAAIVLAHELAGRGDELAGKTVLELGAGTGLPGIVASTLGARVTQTDHDEAVLSFCRRNGDRNKSPRIEYRMADWGQWEDPTRYDWIIASDILYAEAMHDHLRRIFANNLAPSGRLLLSDPFRQLSIRCLEALEGDGWRIAMTKWTVEDGEDERAIGVFELTRG